MWRRRLKNRVQISTDGLGAYVEAVEQAFGANVDFAQIIKSFCSDGNPPTRKCIGMNKKAYHGPSRIWACLHHATLSD